VRWMAESHEPESSVLSLAKTLGNVVHAYFFRAFWRIISKQRKSNGVR